MTQGSTALASQPTSPTELAISLVLIPVQIVLGTFIQSGITHVSLMICGGANKPFEATFRTFAYAGGAISALFFIPVCGWAAAGIWGIVVQCIGLARVHEIGTGRAVLAVFLPLIVCCALGIGAAMLIGALPTRQALCRSKVRAQAFLLPWPPARNLRIPISGRLCFAGVNCARRSWTTNLSGPAPRLEPRCSDWFG